MKSRILANKNRSAETSPVFHTFFTFFYTLFTFLIVLYWLPNATETPVRKVRGNDGNPMTAS